MRLSIPTTRETPAEYEASDSELCNAEGCGEYPNSWCDVCSKPACEAHSKVIEADGVKDRICFECLEDIRKMEKGK